MLLREWPEQAFAAVAMDMASGERRTLFKAGYGDSGGGQMRGLTLSPDGRWLATIRMKDDKEEQNRELLLVLFLFGVFHSDRR